ncbi:hypothetical protein D3C71_1153790 [compost metagenome]
MSEWSIQLIELDAPELRDAHRQATIQGQRDKHRHVILQYCNQHPAAGRSELAKHCAAAMDWLRTFDFDWLKKNLPEQKYGVKGKRTPRRDWHQFDLSRVEIIRRTVQDELRKLSRPERLTASRLLNSASVLSKPRHLIPLAVAEAERHAEDEDAYLRRRIAWALEAYEKRHVPISMNQLRRVAALHPDRIKEYGEYIVEIATERGLVFDARCALSPLRR